jgi:predicted dehydrogenase
MSDPLMGYDCTITGTAGSAFVGLYNARLRWRRIDEEPHERTWSPPDRWAPSAWITGGGIAEGESEALRALLAEFADAAASGSDPPITGDDGARAVELAQAGYLSITEGRPVALPLAGSDRVRRTYLELPEAVVEEAS